MSDPKKHRIVYDASVSSWFCYWLEEELHMGRWHVIKVFATMWGARRYLKWIERHPRRILEVTE